MKTIYLLAILLLQIPFVHSSEEQTYHFQVLFAHELHHGTQTGPIYSANLVPVSPTGYNQLGSITWTEGKGSIDLPKIDGPWVIEISYYGYISQTVTIAPDNQQKSFTVTLKLLPEFAERAYQQTQNYDEFYNTMNSQTFAELVSPINYLNPAAIEYYSLFLQLGFRKEGHLRDDITRLPMQRTDTALLEWGEETSILAPTEEGVQAILRDLRVLMPKLIDESNPEQLKLAIDMEWLPQVVDEVRNQIKSNFRQVIEGQTPSPKFLSRRIDLKNNLKSCNLFTGANYNRKELEDIEADLIQNTFINEKIRISSIETLYKESIQPAEREFIGLKFKISLPGTFTDFSLYYGVKQTSDGPVAVLRKDLLCAAIIDIFWL